MRLRLLPVLIVAGATLLTVRAGTMWQAASYDAGEVASAQTAQPTAGETPAAAPAAATSEAPAAPAATAPAATGAGDPAGATAAPETAENGINPFDYSDSEIELLQSLAERRAELDKRESGIAEREALIAAAEMRVDEKLADLKQVEASIQAAMSAQQATNEQMASLVKIYETMKPKDAARIFDQLDFPVLVEVVSRMREMKSAPVLAAMDPEKAKLVTVALAALSDQRSGDPTASAVPAPPAVAAAQALAAPAAPPPPPAPLPAAAPAP
jgi:flagellar motility protein MotE (MotC chaperone)